MFLMEEKNIIACKNREQWRSWLFTHFEDEEEIWLIIPNDHKDKESVNYNDAVEEALCVNWIDGIAYSYDETHQIRRFTPRKNNKHYSQLNIERLIFLDGHHLIHPKYEEAVRKITSKPFKYPSRIINALQKDEIVWNNYLSFPDSYKRIRIAHIMDAKEDKKEYKKRLNNFINKTRDNKIITGFGGSEKYYQII